jgi:hypothetical protein
VRNQSAQALLAAAAAFASKSSTHGWHEASQQLAHIHTAGIMSRIKAIPVLVLLAEWADGTMQRCSWLLFAEISHFTPPPPPGAVHRPFTAPSTQQHAQGAQARR